MMPPDIPTDNLYKFIAISGITLIALSFLPFYYGWNLDIEVTRLEGEVQILNKQKDWQLQDINDISERLSNVETQIAKLSDETVITIYEPRTGLGAAQTRKVQVVHDHPGKKSELEDALRIRDKLNVENSENHLRLREAMLSEARMNTELAVKEASQNKADSAQNLALGFLITGSVLTGLGFVLWLFRTQIPMDRALRIQISKEKGTEAASDKEEPGIATEG